MADNTTTRCYKRIDWQRLEEIQLSERPPLGMRWRIVLPLAVFLAVAQAYICIRFESYSTGIYLIASQISIIAFAFLMVLGLGLNPLLRWTRIMAPFNRAEMMTLFASIFVSAGISGYGLMDQLIPMMAMPFDPAYNVPGRGWDKHVIPYLNPSLYVTDPAVLHKFRVGLQQGENLWRSIPWLAWIKPLSLWLIFVFAIYTLFYSLATLLYDSWARREKLVFPLARLPQDLIHDDGAPAGAIASTIRSPLFWVGFVLVFGLLSFNATCDAELIRGLQPIPMGIPQTGLNKMVFNSIFKGIAEDGGFSFRVVIIFVAIGISFLLPLEISASIWIYFLLGILGFLIAIWMAVGANVKSFHSDWLWENNFITSLGAGGVLSLAAVSIIKVLWDRSAAAQLEGRARGESGRASFLGNLRRTLGGSGLLFIVALIVCVGWLRWARIPVQWGLAFMAVVILVTVALMRIVCEAGIYWFQVHVSPFHLAKMAGGAAVVPKAVLAPLMPIYSIMFLEVKTFLAPAIINSFAMQSETRASRRWFHSIVVVAIVAAVAASFVTLLCTTYQVGANSSNGWFFTNGPRSILDAARRLVSGILVRKVEYNWIFYLIGAMWVVLSLLLRRRFFWWLHPIGLIMLANPLICQLWFSFFIGWCFKKLAVKYGGRHMYARVRPAFIGLIFGQLAACFIWSLLAYFYDWDKVRVDIDIYGPP